MRLAECAIRARAWRSLGFSRPGRFRRVTPLHTLKCHNDARRIASNMAATREARIRKWLRARGYTLATAARYSVDGDTKTVYFRRGDGVETRVRGLLHECGHIMLFRTMADNELVGARYRGRYMSARGHNRSKRGALSVLDEESEAWFRGARLAQRLGLRLDWPAYWRDAGACVFTYVRALAAKRL